MVELYKRSLYMRARKVHEYIKLSEGFLRAVDRLLAVWLFFQNPSRCPLARLQTTTLCYNEGLEPDEKRRTADSFVANKLSVSPETERPIGQFYSC